MTLHKEDAEVLSQALFEALACLYTSDNNKPKGIEGVYTAKDVFLEVLNANIIPREEESLGCKYDKIKDLLYKNTLEFGSDVINVEDAIYLVRKVLLGE